MKKFKLVRMSALGVAATLTVNLAACSLKDNKSNDVSISMTGIEDFVPFAAGTVFDSEAPIVLPMESFFTKDGILAYSVPKDYVPYSVTEHTVIPGEILEDHGDYAYERSCYVRLHGGKVIDFSDAVLIYMPYWQAINYKYDILSEDSNYICNLVKADDNVGSLVDSCYSLPEGYCLYTADLDKQFLAIPSITLEDGTQVFALTDEEAQNCVGVTTEAYQMLGIIDEYEKQALALYNESTEIKSR